jgi:Na+/phosphate symporter
MEKTAVEWLESQLTEYLQRIYKSEINQAKEMEKQQIIDAFDGFPLSTRNSQNGEEYY